MPENALISTMPAILSWKPLDSILNRIHVEYEELLFNALGYLLSRLNQIDDKKEKKLLMLTESLDNDTFRLVLTSPEVSYRLFFCLEQPNETASFLEYALMAEHCLLKKDSINCESIQWTVLGQRCSKNFSEKDSYDSRLYGGTVPIDLDSPFALKISLLDGEHANSKQSPGLYTGEIRSKALEQVHTAQNYIRNIDAYVNYFTLKFTKVLILRCDLEKPNSFGSSSSGKYTGRTMLINPHRERVAGAVLVDGIVHETIHSILYMLEKKRPWLIDINLYFDESLYIESPWTGTQLRLRPFLQACFVWYGLLNFWSNPTTLSHISPPDALNMAKRAYVGFTKGSLVDIVRPWQKKLDDKLLEAINTLQKNVLL